MTFNPDRHHRRSIRWKVWDYAHRGAYFVTICTQGRECALGEVASGTVRLTEVGALIDANWQMLPNRFPTIRLDEYVVMPNHLHGIVVLRGVSTTDVGERGRGMGDSDARRDGMDDRQAEADDNGDQRTGADTRPAPTLGAVICAFKSITTTQYLRRAEAEGWPPLDRRFWQRNYYERVIRNDAELRRVRGYILGNPRHWARDQDNPANW